MALADDKIHFYLSMFTFHVLQTNHVVLATSHDIGFLDNYWEERTGQKMSASFREDDKGLLPLELVRCSVA